MTKRGLDEYIYCLIVGSVYLYAVNYSVLTSTVIHVSPGVLFLTGLAALCVYMLVFFNRYTCCAAGILILLSAAYIYLTRESRITQWEYLQELLLLARGFIAYREEYTRPVLVFICAGTALVTTLFLYVRFHFYVLVLGGASTFVVNWIMNYHRDDSAFMLFIICFCLLLVKKINLTLNKDGRPTLAALLALPVCVLAVFLASRVPGQEAAGAGQSLAQLLDKPIAVVNEFVYLAFNPKYFSFQTTGFTGVNDRLGGPVAVNNREVMTVEAPGRAYLGGATKNTYTGANWTDTLAEGDLPGSGFDRGRLEFLETAASLMRYTSFYKPGPYRLADDAERIIDMFPEIDRPQLRPRMFAYLDSAGIIYSYLPAEVLRITVGANRTGTLFRPHKADTPVFDQAEVLSGYDLTASPAGDWQTAQLMAQGMSYHYQYLNVNRQLEVMTSVLNLSRKGYYREAAEAEETSAAEDADDENFEQDGLSAAAQTAWSDFDALYRMFARDGSQSDGETGLFSEESEWLMRNGYARILFVNAIDDFETQVLVHYADSVYRHYTQLPDTLPERVYHLAAEVVGDCVTDYERVKALEAYLRTFPYTLTPVPVPEDADFVDHFLFEGKEGYCTYYASAMAVLSRCVGIPSRYVEGYLLPSSPTAGGVYTVTNKNAHAWAEVYLEGYGWLAVEATTPYYYAAAPRTNTSAAGMFTPSFMDDPQYEEHLRNIGFDEGMIPQPAVPIADQPVEDAASSLVATLLGMGRFVAFGAGVGLLLLLFFCIQRLREFCRLYRVARLPVNEQARLYFDGLLKMTSYYHYPVKDGETPRVYAARLGKRFAFKSDTVFLRDLVSLYYKARYGKDTLNERELSLLRDCYTDMVVFLRSVRMWPRFVYLRYIRRVTLL